MLKDDKEIAANAALAAWKISVANKDIAATLLLIPFKISLCPHFETYLAMACSG